MPPPELPEMPDSLKSLKPYLNLANLHDDRDLVVAYWCRLETVQQGLKISTRSMKETQFFMKLMQWLEQTKQENKENEAITNEIVAQAHLENWALKLFLYADENDRAGNFNKNVIQAFYSSSVIYQLLKTFGPLNEEAERNMKYAKWKSVYINNCLKKGETPISGPLEDDKEEDDESNIDAEEEVREYIENDDGEFLDIVVKNFSADDNDTQENNDEPEEETEEEKHEEANPEAKTDETAEKNEEENEQNDPEVEPEEVHEDNENPENVSVEENNEEVKEDTENPGTVSEEDNDKEEIEENIDPEIETENIEEGEQNPTVLEEEKADEEQVENENVENEEAKDNEDKEETEPGAEPAEENGEAAEENPPKDTNLVFPSVPSSSTETRESQDFPTPLTPNQYNPAPTPTNGGSNMSFDKDSFKVKTEGGVELNPEQMIRAQKLIKWAGSALNYDDVPTAITNLRQALNLLTTGQEQA